MDLAIIVINWNTRQTLHECLASIKTNVKNISVETVLVDNGSTDGSVDMVRENYPDIRIIQNPENYGFARAANQGLQQTNPSTRLPPEARLAKGGRTSPSTGRRTSARYKLILNSDTLITPNALEELVRYLNKHPKTALAGPQLLNLDGSRQNSFANFPTVIGELFNRSILEVLFPKRYPSKRQVRTEPFAVDSLVGACMMVRSSAIKNFGLLDEDYFVFLEETDWCLRIRRQGYEINVVPAARVYHLQGETKKQLLIPAKIEYLNSLYKFFRKHRSNACCLLMGIGQPLKIMFEFLTTFTAMVLTLGLVKKLKNKTSVLFNICLWHFRLRPERMTLKHWQPTTRPLIRVNWLIKSSFLEEALNNLEFSEDLNPRGKGLFFELLKEHKVKKLWRLTIHGTENIYLLKIYHGYHPFNWLRRLFQGPKAMKEFNLSRQVAYRGVNTIVPEAVGVSRKAPRGLFFSILVTRELKTCSNLSAYFLTPAGVAPFDQPTRTKNILAYGQLANTIHKRGIRQEDFDPNNILIQTLPDHRFKLWFIDLERVKLGRRLDIEEQIWSLAKLNRIRERISTPDRIRFLKAYLNFKGRAITKTWLKKIKEAQDQITEQNYRWAKLVSWIESRNIGRYHSAQFKGFYRKKYPQLHQPGFTKEEINRLVHHLDEAGEITKEIPGSGRSNGSDQAAGPVTVKIFPGYGTAKKLWAELNACLRIHRPLVLPVAVLKKKNKRPGYLIYQSLTTETPPPAFFRNERIEQRLTELKKMI